MLKSTDSSSLIGKLIQTLTKNESLELKPEVMKKIKYFCRESPKNISHVYHLFMRQLCQDSSKTRYLALLAINDFFLCSNSFRNLVEQNLEELLELTLETNPNRLLPPPKSVADRLKLKALQIIKDWYAKFGDKCKIMKFGFAYLKSCLGVNFDNPQMELSGSHGHRARESSRRAINLAEKIIRTKKEMESMEPDIYNVVQQIENCFRLVLPVPNDLFSPEDLSSTSYGTPSNNVTEENGKPALEAISAENFPLRHHGIHTIHTGLNIQFSNIISITVEKNDNNAPILETMNDLYMQICRTYMPTVATWLKVFTKGENCLDLIRKAIDLKQLLDAAVCKFKEIKFESKVVCPEVPKSESSDSDSDFEDVEEKDGFEATVDPNASGPVSSTSFDGATKGHEKPQTCRALLPSGKLCPRQDKYKCPFHGKIIERNEHGIPVHVEDQLNCLDQPSTSHQTLPDWQDPELLKDIAAQTGIDLHMPLKRTKNGSASKQLGTKCKNSTSTKSKNSAGSTYSRLYKKIFKKGRKFC